MLQHLFSQVLAAGLRAKKTSKQSISRKHAQGFSIPAILQKYHESMSILDYKNHQKSNALQIHALCFWCRACAFQPLRFFGCKPKHPHGLGMGSNQTKNERKVGLLPHTTPTEAPQVLFHPDCRRDKPLRMCFSKAHKNFALGAQQLHLIDSFGCAAFRSAQEQ